MEVTFHIDYGATEEQKMFISGATDRLGHWEVSHAKEMIREGSSGWTVTVTLPTDLPETEYRYLLKTAEGEIISEPWAIPHRAIFDVPRSVYHLYDYWQEKPPDIQLYTSAFTKVIFAREADAIPIESYKRVIIIRLLAPRVKKDQHIAIVGNQELLGNWDPSHAKTLTGKNFPEWEIRLNRDDIVFPLEYKFIICEEGGGLSHWESGGNRIISHIDSGRREAVIISDFPFRSDLPLWRGAGTVIPVFSLRSRQSVGIGDLHDLKLLIDWAVQTNQRLIQVLPMNDTTRTHTWLDSYPYSAISIYALHPIYISLRELGSLRDPAKSAFYKNIQQELNSLSEIDYEHVEHIKLQYLRDFFDESGQEMLRTRAFKTFFEAAKSWLIPYASFCYHRDHYRTADFSQWGEHSAYDAEREAQLHKPEKHEYQSITFTYFLQYIAHTQFKTVAEYARRRGIILKGDLPIGIHRTSVEAWTDPIFFNMSGQAGAPPDAFSETGQNWSFPTYNWDEMSSDEFEWWRSRFHRLEDYFTSFRLDHILGFFRIWEIPLEYVEGLCGHFRPALPLTITEIESYGLTFSDLQTTPRIHCRHLAELFGDDMSDAISLYLSQIPGTAYWQLKPFCDTQRKIESLFQTLTTANSAQIKSGLFAIANEILLLEDPYERGTYHPRISADKSFAYRDLPPEVQQSFDRLSSHFFYERHNVFWRSTALDRLVPLTASTDMLICGEDLGMIPQPVHEMMNSLNILTLDLERAPKVLGVEFTDLTRLPYETVCTTSTHDMPPLRAWWSEDLPRTERYYRTVLHGKGAVPSECTSDLSRQILLNHLNSPAMLTIIPLQDWLSISDLLKHPDPVQERINIPSSPRHYWRYRMHIPIEVLLKNHEFTDAIRELISESGR